MNKRYYWEANKTGEWGPWLSNCFAENSGRMREQAYSFLCRSRHLVLHYFVWNILRHIFSAACLDLLLLLFYFYYYCVSLMFFIENKFISHTIPTNYNFPSLLYSQHPPLPLLSRFTFLLFPFIKELFSQRQQPNTT